MINYYFDENEIYTHELPATAGTITPDNALRIAPILKDGFQPILNVAKDGWAEIEDHRQQKDKRDRIIEGTGTPYWLDGDNYQNEAKYMIELGELPQGAITVKPLKTLAEAKTEKLAELKQNVRDEENNGYVESSLDFKADATRKSKEDVDGIIQSMENAGTSSIAFRDYDNIFHTLTLEQVKILQIDIVNKGLYIYQHKWDLQTLVESAQTIAEVEGIIW